MHRINRTQRTVLASACVAVCLLYLVGFSGSAAKIASPGPIPVAERKLTPASRRQHLSSLFAEVPLGFERNDGQLPSLAKFAARSVGFTLTLGATGALVEADSPNAKRTKDRLRYKLIGANEQATIRGIEKLPGTRNYLLGSDRRKWHTDVPTFRGVRYEDVYPEINLTYYGNQKQLEYDFEISPGGDPQRIAIDFADAQPKLIESGDLLLRTRFGEVLQKKPVIYQETDGKRQSIEGEFVLRKSGLVGFQVGAYDHSRSLIIDPILVYASYLGGAGDDSGAGVAVDSNNNVYIVGTTSSTNFPMRNPAFGANAGLGDIFVTKIDSTGSNIVYSTYIGGSGQDRGDAIAIDQNGNAYVAGRVDSTSTNFPTTPGSFAPVYRGGDFDGVVFKLNPSGNNLVYSGFLGGEENDSVEGITVDAAGVVYATGGTKSIAFPTTVNAYQAQRAGDTDAFLTKIAANGSSLIYSSYLGGAGTDRGSGVVVDRNGVAYIDGYTSSADFPTEAAFQSAYGGSFDGFVAKFDTKINGFGSLIFCSYLGGIADDKAFGLALDNTAANLYLVGQTSSSNFPVLNAAQATSGGSFDVFVAKVSTSGTKIFATYLGGNGDDRGTGIAVNSAGEAYVTGFTGSTNFPIVNALQTAKAGTTDAFVAKLNATGSAFLYSTYLGGSGVENNTSTIVGSNPIAVDTSGNAYVTGYTTSTNFPTASPLQGANGGGATDAFLVKISDAGVSADFSIAAAPPSQSVLPGGGTTFNVTVTPSAGFTGTVSLAVSGLSSDASGIFTPSSVIISDTTAKPATLSISTTAATPPGTYSVGITGSANNIQHTTNVSLLVTGATSANLAVQKTASPNPATVGQSLSYRIIVTNAGPSPSTNTTVSDSLPAGVNFVSAVPTQGTCTGTSTVSCNLGNIANGSSAIVIITVVPQGAGQLTNTASVTAAENDPSTADNSATINTPVTTAATGPSMLDPNLSVSTVVTGLSQPTSMAFIGPNDFLVGEKDTGKVRRIVNGVAQSTVLDLAVNSASERGMLGIALHPNFKINGYVYLYWTESSTGIDSTNLAEVPLLGNRVDRYIWNGSVLSFDRNLIKLRAYQADANQPLRGNHNGGVLRFGPDGKLYILMGDNGRRGFDQNVTSGAPVPDDQYGGPEPDNAHLTGFILRLNDDGSTPADNPFFNAQTSFTGEAAANVKKLFAYGVRNGFGLAFDPLSGNLWDQENGDDAMDEMNRVTAGSNNGWVQIMGPVSRVAQYKQIETTYGAGNLQQLRWPPSLIADTPADALSRLFMLPGAHYNDPEFSWKYAIPAAPLGFVQGRGLGPQFEGDMFVGAARTFLAGGFLFRFKLTSDRLHFAFSDSRLNDLVADNLDKFDITESESLLIGKDFGITTDIETGPDGNLFVVSNTNGAVYKISGNQPSVFVANLTGAQETPANNSTATGTATVLLSPDETSALVSLNFGGLSSAQTAAHVHGPGDPGVSAPILFPLPNGNFSDFSIGLTPTNVQDLKAGKLYINVHSNNFPNGEIRGQFGTSASSSSVQFSSASYAATEGSGSAQITVVRLGSTSGAADVSFATSDGTASQRTDYITTAGTLHFAAGETQKTFTVPLVDDSYVESDETVNLALSNPTNGLILGSPNTATLKITNNDTGTPVVNPLDDPQFFVNQHYLDFLNRDPDLPGLTYWTGQITQCASNVACVKDKRIGVSASFLIEAEFQQTGSFVYRLYKGALGRQPSYAEFSQDRPKLIGGPDLLANRAALVNEFVQRPEFKQLYPDSQTNSQFVNKLFDTAGLVPFTTERQQQITAMNSGKPRAQVVSDVIEIQAFKDREYNPSFVLMQYFGYLRRDADAGGYAFWLDVITNREPNNYRGMVCAFISSFEYQLRFSSVLSHSNAECSGVH